MSVVDSVRHCADEDSDDDDDEVRDVVAVDYEDEKHHRTRQMQ